MLRKYLKSYLYTKRRLKELNDIKFGLNENEFFLISYPKSGSTWLRVLLSNILAEDGVPEIGLHNCGDYIPDSHINIQREVIVNKSSKFNSLPVKIVKSHDKYKSFFKNKKVIYIIRNGENVLTSLYFYLKARTITNLDINKIHKEGGSHSYGPWYNHVINWVKNPCYIIQYESLQANPELELGNLAKHLSLHVNKEDIDRAVFKSKFSNMQLLEEKFGYFNDTRTKENKQIAFVRKGATKSNNEIIITKKVLRKIKNNYKKILKLIEKK